jgi:hypothetical protein
MNNAIETSCEAVCATAETRITVASRTLSQGGCRRPPNAVISPRVNQAVRRQGAANHQLINENLVVPVA